MKLCLKETLCCALMLGSAHTGRSLSLHEAIVFCTSGCMFAGYLSEALKIAGPFLVVVPLSTVPNWIKEFRKWTPQLNALVYVGDSKSREVIRSYEFYNHRGAMRPYRFEVCLVC